jgi:frataxin
MDEQEFIALAGRTLERWAEVIDDNAEDFDVDCDGSVLTIELEDERIFIVNRHRPLKQIWLSSPISGASHYVWKAEEGAWVATKTDDRLHVLLSRELTALADTTINLEKER